MRLLVLAASLALSLVAGESVAQTYPDRPIRLVVPFAPGGVIDVVGRALANRLEAQLGQSVIVENRPGAGPLVGLQAVASAAPDGYSLVVVDPSVTTIQTLQPNASFQLKQLTTISTVTTAPLMVVVHPSLPIQNLREMIEYSKKQPNGMTFGSAGIGTTPHLAPELLKVQGGFNATHVPYKGGGPALVDLLSGRIDSLFSTTATVLPMIRDGKIRAIAQTGTARISAQPDVPTGVESGYPDFVVELWTALFAPAGLPANIEAKLNAEVKKATESKEFIAAVEKSGLAINYRDTPAAQKFVQAEAERWTALIKAAKITAE